jgi:hypothetical protein
MKKCSLQHFSESLKPWLESDYIRRVTLHQDSSVTFTFMDGISDTYGITDCSRPQVKRICQDLVERGITVLEQ